MSDCLIGETQLPLKNVRLLACFPERHRPSYYTVRYWAKWGIRGVRLESRRIGGRIFTSAEAVHRFLQRSQDSAIVGGPQTCR